MADYDLTLHPTNSKRASWDLGTLAAPTYIEVEGDSGGGPNKSTVRVPLPFPEYPVDQRSLCLRDADFTVIPSNVDGNGVDWVIDMSEFAQEADTGFITFSIYNYTAVGAPGDTGKFFVAVELRR